MRHRGQGVVRVLQLATQRLLDAWVEQAADALRALSEMAEERLLDLGRPGTSDVIPTRYAAQHLGTPGAGPPAGGDR